MDRKLDAGALLVAAAALLLTVSLFLDWFGTGGATVSAWEAFEVLDLVLLAAAGVAVAAAFGPLEDRLLVAAAATALVVVVSQLIQAPPAGQGGHRGRRLARARGRLRPGRRCGALLCADRGDRRRAGAERRRRVPAVDRRGAGADTEPTAAAAPPEPAPTPAAEPTAVDRFAPHAEDTQAFEATPETPDR